MHEFMYNSAARRVLPTRLDCTSHFLPVGIYGLLNLLSGKNFFRILFVFPPSSYLFRAEESSATSGCSGLREGQRRPLVSSSGDQTLIGLDSHSSFVFVSPFSFTLTQESTKKKVKKALLNPHEVALNRFMLEACLIFCYNVGGK